MSRLFIANCTAQFQEVHFRLDYHEPSNPTGRVPPAKRQTIPPGRQVCLGGDLHINQVNDIVEQLKIYGLIGVMDIGRSVDIVPYVFNIDVPVKEDTFRQIREKNKAVLLRDGRALREKAAIVVNETVQQAVSQQFAEQGLPTEAEAEIEVEFEQLEQSDAGERQIAEGYRMDRSAPHGGQRGGKHKGGRGKR